MKKHLGISILVLISILLCCPAEAKKPTKRKPTTVQPVLFMGHSINCSAKEMHDYLITHKNYIDLEEFEDGKTYRMLGSYAGYESAIVTIYTGTTKIGLIDIRLNVGPNTNDDQMYFELLNALDKKYGKHKLGYDYYKKKLEPYEYALDDETIAARYLANWEKGYISILLNYADTYLPDLEDQDDYHLNITFFNEAEYKKKKQQELNRRTSDM